MREGIDQAMKCVWCLQDHQDLSVEHIIPEALGCPPGLVLSNGEVCRPCNNQISVLDRVLADAFDVMRILAGIKGKKGKPASVAGKRNLRGRAENYGGDFVINVGGPPVDDPNYGRIYAPAGGPTDVSAEFITVGEHAKIKFQATLSSDPKFPRAIHKVAFELFALSEGIELAFSDRFDCIRQFVLTGIGSRRVLCVEPEDQQPVIGAPKIGHFEDESYFVSFLLFGIPFVVDLTSDQHHLDGWCGDLKRERGDLGWTVIPHH